MRTPDWNQITELFRSVRKPTSDRQIGIEIERIGLWPDGTPMCYRTQTVAGIERPGAGKLLEELKARHGWKSVAGPDGQLLGFSSPFGKVSLEPGSQLELSSDPARDLVSLEKTIREFEDKVSAITGPWGLYWLGLGVNPVNRVADLDVIPSPRYHIMTDYLGKHRYGTSMMRLTSSVQINLDYADEPEGIEMLRVALAAAPVSYGLFANSPFSEGKPSGYLSFRGTIWKETDPERTGSLPEVFQNDFDFKKYAEMAWKRPLMFVQKEDGQYVPANGLSLEKIAKNSIPGVVIDENNLMNAVREIFTEARLKPGYIEIRSVDGLPPGLRYAAAAFWMGLLYSRSARQLVLKSLGGLSGKERDQLVDDSTRHGLKTLVKGKSLKAIAEELVIVSRESLKSRGFGEERYLDVLERQLAESATPAERVLASWQGEWKGDMAKVIEHCGVR